MACSVLSLLGSGSYSAARTIKIGRASSSRGLSFGSNKARWAALRAFGLGKRACHQLGWRREIAFSTLRKRHTPTIRLANFRWSLVEVRAWQHTFESSPIAATGKTTSKEPALRSGDRRARKREALLSACWETATYEIWQTRSSRSATAAAMPRAGSKTRLCADRRRGQKTLVHFMLTRSEKSRAGRIRFYSGSKLRNNYPDIMSYGQWGLSYQQLSIGPMTLPMFVKEVGRAIRWLWGFCTNIHLPCAWMGISPSPLVMKGGRLYTQGASLMTTQVQCPPREWRLPHLIHRLNLAAHAAAEHRGLDYIDIWPIALPLLDTSFDGNY